ncbi:CBS domain-containing protein [Candidatus Bathyarchaeota archaeon]|jgi:CBS domain-containing protein|nr:CBS domain-containing protein [Candidatus Bathyarchaeota archaeon]
MASSVDENVATAKDVMSKPVISIRENDNAMNAAKLMEKHKIGGIVIVNKSGKPLGIVTERDLATRVVAKGLQPKDVNVSSIMSRPIVTIDGETSIREVAKKMSRLEIRRLAVASKEDLQGIITSKDILRITPVMMDVLSERSRINANEPIRETSNLAGYCDNCSEWSLSLSYHDGKFHCKDCLADGEDEAKGK